MRWGRRPVVARRSAAFRVARRKRTRASPFRPWNSSSVPPNLPDRAARSKASSATSFTTSGRRATVAPSAARLTIDVA